MPRFRACAVLALFAGCGRIAFAELDSGDATAAATCWPAWKAGTIAFQPPGPITELASPVGRSNPSLSADGLTLYFVEETAGNNDVWFAKRVDLGSPWQDAQSLGGPGTSINTGVDERRFATAGNGTIGIVTSRRSGSLALWYATRPTPTGPFGTASQTLVASLDLANHDQFDPELINDGLVLYFAPTSGSIQQIARATRPAIDTAFAPATMLTELEISSVIGDPTISPDDLVIVFASVVGANNDLFYATRAVRTDPFGTPVSLSSLNTTVADEGDGELSPDGCELLYFSDPTGTDQLFAAKVN
ncbi:MAG: outer membrane protein OmpA family [Myxococcales bacterium]|nr:outer membrane protein OmpA family [Myxococcales bacterium]